MRHKKLELSAILLLGLGLTGLQAQTMYVKESNDTQTAYLLSNVQKIAFSGGNATIQKIDNSTGVYALSGLRYLNFTDLTTSITEQPMQLSNANLITYPNPVNDVLNIDLTGVESEGTIRILTLEGKLLQEQKTNSANKVTLDLSQMPRGIYLCRYVSTTEITTVKIIKQ
jgi:hypothetical protein